jgi:regulator of sirC expression with transglutaminase-like and TPR domain
MTGAPVAMSKSSNKASPPILFFMGISRHDRVMVEAGYRKDIERELRLAGDSEDEAIDLARMALLLAALDEPGVPLMSYEAHLSELVNEARADIASMERPTADMLAAKIAAIIAGKYAYKGDNENYDDLQNANLMRVIDRRKGLPVALGILYLHVARACGIDLYGLNFPGHFVLRLQAGSGAAILDPFNGGLTLTTSDLLDMLRSIEGPSARLTPQSYAPVSSREILLRLQNNILSRALRAEELERAREVVTHMTWLAPKRAGLHFELGRLEVHAGHMAAAATAFESCRSLASDSGEMRIAGMAEEALRRLRTKLN